MLRVLLYYTTQGLEGAPALPESFVSQASIESCNGCFHGTLKFSSEWTSLA